MGFIKQFYQLDKVTSQKVSPLTIALGRKKAERVEDFYSIYVPNQRENKSPRQYCTLGVRDGFLPLSIWMVWETRPRLSHYLEMTVIWGELTVALSLMFQDVQGLIHYPLSSS